VLSHPVSSALELPDGLAREEVAPTSEVGATISARAGLPTSSHGLVLRGQILCVDL